MDSPEDVSSACPEGLTVAAAASESGCYVGVIRATGQKCERCWYHCKSVGSHDDFSTVCTRCRSVVLTLGVEPPPPSGASRDTKSSEDEESEAAAVAGAVAAAQ